MPESQHKAEKMAEFFDRRADGYDEHMQGSIEAFQAFYGAIGSPITPTGKKIRILDLGSGTGLALGPIFSKAPNAEIIAVDLSKKMLKILVENYQDKQDQIDVVVGSYLDFAFPQGTFDYVVSVMTLHHLPPEKKVPLYKNIRCWLKDGGRYIEGDYTVSGVKEEDGLHAYRRLMSRLKNAAPGLYHIDVPLSIKTQHDLMSQAGFINIKSIWHEEQAVVLAAENAKN